jgi:hypothetical protein
MRVIEIITVFVLLDPCIVTVYTHALSDSSCRYARASAFRWSQIARSSDSENTQDDLAHSLAIMRLLALFPSLFREFRSERLILFVRVDEWKENILVPMFRYIASDMVLSHSTS